MDQLRELSGMRRLDPIIIFEFGVILPVTLSASGRYSIHVHSLRSLFTISLFSTLKAERAYTYLQRKHSSSVL